MKALAHLNKYFFKYRGRLLLGLVITIVARVFALLTPKFVGDSVYMVEQYVTGKISDFSLVEAELIKNILLILGTTLLAGFFTFMMRQTFIVVSRYIEFDLKNEVFKQYEALSLGFYKKNRTGDLMNRISEDVSKVRMYVGPAIMYSTTTITLFVVVIGYMCYIAPTLTLYAVAPLPVLSFLIYKLSVAINKRSTIVQQYLSRLTSITQESFSGIAVIKAYGTETRTQEEFRELAEGSKQKNIDLVKVQALFFPLMMLLIGVSNLTVIYIGGRQYMNGTIDFGTVVEFLIYVNMLTWPVAIVGWVSSMVQQAEASQKRINEFLDQVPAIKSTATERTPVTGGIAFKNVSYTYPDTGITALKNVSFTVRPGETVAIIGNTGSGKSTVLELIARLYDIDSGALLIGAAPIDKLNLTDLRESIGYVPQDAFLFSDTIANNICFGKGGATKTEIENAAKQAAVHDNIEGFSKKYNCINLVYFEKH
ncbi:MAG: ABC transporter transmembrane domain-containing protein, partial [Marinirhabdus sp.]